MSDSNSSIENSCVELKHTVSLDLSGFSKTVPTGSVRQLMFDPVPAELQFQQFAHHVRDNIGRRFLPIYRMADGEFMFAVGPYAALNSNGQRNLLSYTKVKAKHVLAKLPGSSRYGGVSTIWGESYSRQEIQNLRANYVRYLQEIAEEGMLALHFVYSEGRFGEQYISPVCQWLGRNGVVLNRRNYTSFYFVYALLTGPYRRLLFKDRSVAIVSSADQEKRTRIAAALLAEGSTKVQFVVISPTHALTETVDLSGLQTPVDVVLVAAGIGSANILVQLRSLNTVCIDGGICVECLAQPERKMERIFLLSDDPLCL